ncbi:ATP-binding cassette domain-containing protein [Gordonia amarae]|uniref:ATP-binding cassette domain-containing protein n=2 Tax=Gordonia amarae TaxID=36821 RepID=A0A857KEZ6_9ACTN|nr:ABC-2 type transport system ATP-binding protein [Gordonia amarae]QHN15704.1 ATP-binding cassette domain-containing protein [Gordonia amarae]QHN20273.1 ATP-binding cassette domain-containing protein [Gordonia amarae]QHN29124.1 ATP-binding cassette domain-containing protein [Gordonia amarae]QHN37904.1 ATP-binding cassette domain-containing protein [Gordonia amarae]
MMNSSGGELSRRGSSAIRCAGVSVRRGGHPALRDIGIDIPRGAITGLLGPSGCGKTTLLRTIVGTQSHVSGQVDVLGRPAGSPELRGLVGYVTQAASVYEDLTVAQNVHYFATIFGTKDAVSESIAAVGLDDKADAQASDLSGGQRSRVSLACALVSRPQVLILDEPTVGLDPVLRADLWRRFRRLADDGVTLLVSSHVMDEAEQCDNLILMREGGLVAELTPDELRARTGHNNLEKAFLALIEAGGQ